MAPEVRVQLGNRLLAEEFFDPICQLYDQVFSRPPFHWTDDESQHHRELLASLKDDPSFGIVTAEAAVQLIGFAYGYALAADTRFWQNFIEPLPEVLTREWPGRTFILIDLAVDEAWRGRGLGRELTQTLLASRSERRAVLSVQPAATDTHAFYVHLGWHKVGQKKMPPGVVVPLFDIYAIELGPQP